ncbi:hypothetical protein HPB50_008980 [Hyalomma asiaticum]|uniref:Uncharacterized protein n=1 Tax=Hyalomma asiaticum TaxID=266040 RepID=A0ACB7T8P3_HYAAI|nr:hypothetical protein HPB50_008980 [Hyalomma asiaticum]
MTDETLRSLSKQFLACVPVAQLRKLLETVPSELLTQEFQESLVGCTVLHPTAATFPPRPAYIRNFLKCLINKLEEDGVEIADSLYVHYAEKLGSVNNDEDVPGFVTYTIASKFLSEWCLENKHLLRSKHIVELGCGVGLTGIVVCKTCYPLSFTFTDGHNAVLNSLEENLGRNGVTDCHTRVEMLCWGDHESFAESCTADVILGADLVYDPEVVPALVETLTALLEKGGTAYIASTIRNPETRALFLGELDKAPLQYEPCANPQNKVFFYDRSCPVKIDKSMADVDIKAELSSHPSTTPSVMGRVDIRVQPSVLPYILVPVMMGVDIKEEPSSPSSTPPPGAQDMASEEQCESPALLPRIVSVTTLANTSETSEGTGFLNSDERITKGATESSPKKAERSGLRSAKDPVRKYRTLYPRCPPGFDLNEYIRPRGKRFTCAVCGQGFSRKSSLTEHQTIHSGEKPHACPTCGETFRVKSYLAIHQRVHSGDRPYVCDVCGQTYLTKSHLNVHHRMHSGERRYACLVCGQMYIRKSHLVAHQTIHSGEKPYACSVCGQAFRVKSYLLHHERIHSGERPFACLVCGRTYIKKSHLVVHERVHSDAEPQLASSLDT